MLKKLITEWQLTADDKSVPRSHGSLVAAFAGIDPSKPGQYSLDLLLAEGYAHITPLGEYVLTRKGCELRKKLGNAYTPYETQQSQKQGNPLEWTRFGKLLGYYCECIRRQSPGKDYLYEEDLGYKYLIPNLGYNWLKTVDQESPVNTVRVLKHDLPAQAYLQAVSSEQKLFIGYPVEAFEYNGKTLYTPIGLIPVEIVGGSRTTLDLQLDHRAASINPSWMDFNIPKQDKGYVFNSILGIHKHDKHSGEIDLALALPWLERYSKGMTELDQNFVDFYLPQLKPKEKRLCNTPVLFAAQNSTYTKTLLLELERIKSEPAEVLDRTALAYIFREHPVKTSVPEEQDVAIPFIDSNEEQRQAVTEALNKPLSRVTGPPGTGKSQVAVNIIANLVLRGRSVLFTSKNHKAVHAIAERSMRVAPNLVRFCSTPDGQTTRFWYESSMDEIYAEADLKHCEADSQCLNIIKVAEKSHREIEEKFADRQKANNEVNKTRMAKEAKEALLKQLLPEGKRPNGTDLARLAEQAESYREKPRWSWSLTGILANLGWWLTGVDASERSQNWLKKRYPSLFNGRDFAGVKQRIADYLAVGKLYLKDVENYEQACSDASRQPAITPEDLDKLDEQKQTFEAQMARALGYSMTEPLIRIGGDDAHMALLKNVMGLFKQKRGAYQVEVLNSEQKATAEAGVRHFLECCPAWATTLLSLTKASPFIPGIFDHVVIDEASQCDIAPMIPALFRAKRATLIGDPQQFPPVINIPASIHSFLIKHLKIDDLGDKRFTYLDHSAFDVATEKSVLLRDHYRCHPDIAAFSNEQYYDNQLNVCTVEDALKYPEVFGLKRLYEWVDITGGPDAEIQAVEQHLQMLAASGYQGTVGVITPFRAIAERMSARFQKFDGPLKEFLVNTANGFQGGERDLIIFVPSYNDSLTKGQKWYSESDDNRYIYNVAVSRARACLLVVGDREKCRQSGVKVLQALADHPKPKKEDPKPRFDSVWEERLYTALQKAGIVTQPQYPVSNRRLDMAYAPETLKLDIEVDGVRYHSTEEYGRKADDIYRDLQLRSLGWTVQRFWVYELEQDMDKCVRTVKQVIKQLKASYKPTKPIKPIKPTKPVPPTQPATLTLPTLPTPPAPPTPPSPPAPNRPVPPTEYFVPNKDLFISPWPESDRNNWPESYTAWYETCGHRGMKAELNQDEKAFSWGGIPGTCYRINSYLPCVAWNGAACERLASWKCAIFAPDTIDKEKPIVILCSGIGEDFSVCRHLVPQVVQHLGCICIAYETPATGTRVLTDEPYTSIELNMRALAKKFGANMSGVLTCMTIETSFNARQAVDLAARIYELPHRRFVTYGCALGAYYAYQIAFSQPTCLGAVGACGSPAIKDYRTPFGLSGDAYTPDEAPANQQYHFCLGDKYIEQDPFALSVGRFNPQDYVEALRRRGIRCEAHTSVMETRPFHPNVGVASQIMAALKTLIDKK